MFHNQNSFNSDELIPAIKAIMLNAGDLALQHFQKPMTVRLKGGASPVTDVDLTINAFLQKKLYEVDPHAAYISEEGYQKLPDRGSAWLIDPLDGTANFVHGLPMFCIALAYVRDGAVQFSVINIPVLRQLFWADSKGAYLNGQSLPLLPLYQHHLVFMSAKTAK